MKANKNLIAVFILCLLQPVSAAAYDISDEVTDVEEITADSEAAKAEALKARAMVRQEQTENIRELKNVRDARNKAAQKRAQAGETLQTADGELKRLAGEKALLNNEIVKFNHDILVSERSIEESKAKLAKMKADIAALQATKAEKAAKVADLNQQKMQMMREVGMADDQFAVTQRELGRLLADEKESAEELEKAKQEEAVRKVQLDAKIKEIKDQIQATRSQAKVIETDVRKYKAHNKRLDSQIQVGMGELNAGGQ
jgi:chromosome segregation ATPase